VSKKWREKNRECFVVSLFLSLVLQGCGGFRTRAIILIRILIPAHATLHLRIANRVGEDSCCRGGIVNTRGCCSCVPRIRPQSPTALWQFRASTPNSLSGRTRPPTDLHTSDIHHTFARQDTRVYEDDHLKPPKLQYKNPEALWLLRVSISGNFRHSRWPPEAARAHVLSSIGHSFATQYFTISRLPCSAAAKIVHLSHLHFFSSRAHLSNSSLFVLATCEQKILSLQCLDSLGHNDLFSHATSKVEIDDISFTLNLLRSNEKTFFL